MRENKRQVGARGEDRACEYLMQRGYVILERNCYMRKIGELDIIARDTDQTIVFVEVRLRTSSSPQYQLLNAGKLRHLRLSALLWLKQHGYPEYSTAFRIDLIVICGAKLRHLRSIT